MASSSVKQWRLEARALSERLTKEHEAALALREKHPGVADYQLAKATRALEEAVYQLTKLANGVPDLASAPPED